MGLLLIEKCHHKWLIEVAHMAGSPTCWTELPSLQLPGYIQPPTLPSQLPDQPTGAESLSLQSHSFHSLDLGSSLRNLYQPLVPETVPLKNTQAVMAGGAGEGRDARHARALCLMHGVLTTAPDIDLYLLFFPLLLLLTPFLYLLLLTPVLYLLLLTPFLYLLLPILHHQNLGLSAKKMG